jgi:hypothetical protein
MGWLDALFGSDEASDDVSDEPHESDDTDEAPDEAATASIAPLDLEEARATVLFPFPLDWTRDDVAGAADAADVSAETIESNGRGTFRLVTSERTLRLQTRDGPHPGDDLERRLLPEGFPDTYAHVSIALDPDGSAIEPAPPFEPTEDADDPWREGGELEMLTRIVRALLQRDGAAVVLERADRLVVPGQQFLEATEGIDTSESRPFAAWLALDHDGGSALRSTGFEAWGLPELHVTLEHPHPPGRDDADEPDWLVEQWRADREREALLYLGSELVRRRRTAADTIGELDVPLGFEVDEAHTGYDDERDDETTPYRVEREGDVLTLTSSGAGTVWETWRSIDDDTTTMASRAYRALFHRECRRRLEAEDPPLRGTIPFDDLEEMGRIDLAFYYADAPRPTLAVTNGLGVQTALGETLEGGTSHLEIAVPLEQLHDQLADVLFNVVAGLVLEERTWAPGDVVEFEEPLHGLQYLVLDPLFDVSPPAGPPIDVWQLIPIDEQERNSFDGDDASSWLDEQRGELDVAGRWEAMRG